MRVVRPRTERRNRECAIGSHGAAALRQSLKKASVLSCRVGATGVARVQSAPEPLEAVLNTLLEATAEEDGENNGYLPVENEAQAHAAMTAVAIGAIGTVGHKLPVKARSLGISGKRLRKVLKHAKQVRMCHAPLSRTSANALTRVGGRASLECMSPGMQALRDAEPKDTDADADAGWEDQPDEDAMAADAAPPARASGKRAARRRE